MFTETDLAVRHRYRFGRDNRWVLEPFISIRNLFDEENELVRAQLISSTNFNEASLTAGGCTTCTDEVTSINRIFNGGIRQYVLNFIGTGVRNDYNLPTTFQGPREVRFGARFYF
jgi:hypothetical protein